MNENFKYLVISGLLTMLQLTSNTAIAQTLPLGNSTLFSGSGDCALCHTGGPGVLRDSLGTDLSIIGDWRSTMMANAAKDPLWQAKVESEIKENPGLQSIIEDKCTTCHAPLGRTEAIFDWAAGYTLKEMRMSNLAMDGVSCTLCHQIQPDNLESDDSYTGNYIIKNERIIFGPYADVFTRPMQNHVDYTPEFGKHVQSSELCATCHTLFTPYVDDEGNIAGEFAEQVPYLEWLNSVYSEKGIQCQDCHMPRVDEDVKIASMPPFIGTQSPFWRHVFVGGNAFMLQILRDNADEIGVTASQAQFDATIQHTRDQLQNRTARLNTEAIVDSGKMTVTVSIENLTGHKFPTGFPGRRAWLHIRVENEDGENLYESGGFDESGRIVGMEGMFEPHRDRIDSENQVQIYEAVMEDVNGALTYTLLRAARNRKDNRLPPKGFVTNHERYPDIALHGQAQNDPNFNRDIQSAGSGTDVVTYFIDVTGQPGPLSVLVELLYQTVKPDFVADLFKHDTEAVNRFKGYYATADKTPEMIQAKRFSVTID